LMRPNFALSSKRPVGVRTAEAVGVVVDGVHHMTRLFELMSVLVEADRPRPIRVGVSAAETNSIVLWSVQLLLTTSSKENPHVSNPFAIAPPPRVATRTTLFAV
jgi:hypothetical protein